MHKRWDLAKWLLNNNQEFINRYKDLSTRNINIPNRIENTQRRTKHRLNDLVNLQLIKVNGYGKETKGTGTVPIYSFTDFGLLLAWLIKSINPEEQVKAENEIFNLIDSLLTVKEDSSSATSFYSQFFRKCKEKGAFGEIVQHIIDVLHSKHIINSMQELFEHVADLGFKDEKIRRDFMDLWNKIFEELDQNIKALVLFQMKLDAERRFQNSKEYLTKEYEEVRFQNRNNYDSIVIEGTCDKCGTGPVILPYLEYRKRFAVLVDLQY
jgi:hypothetical protein